MNVANVRRGGLLVLILLTISSYTVSQASINQMLLQQPSLCRQNTAHDASPDQSVDVIRRNFLAGKAPGNFVRIGRSHNSGAVKRFSDAVDRLEPHQTSLLQHEENPDTDVEHHVSPVCGGQQVRDALETSTGSPQVLRQLADGSRELAGRTRRSNRVGRPNFVRFGRSLRSLHENKRMLSNRFVRIGKSLQ